jgi:hypothetical protein
MAAALWWLLPWLLQLEELLCDCCSLGGFRGCNSWLLLVRILTWFTLPWLLLLWLLFPWLLLLWRPLPGQLHSQ